MQGQFPATPVINAKMAEFDELVKQMEKTHPHTTPAHIA